MNEEELTNRIRNAIILLKEGHPFQVGDLMFACKDNRHFSVTGWSLKRNLEDISKKTALEELNQSKEIFCSMVNASNELSNFIKGKQVEYYLGYDYGMGSLGICKEIDGQIEWELDIKKIILF